MANAELIESLNRVLSLELAGVIQYLQHSFLVTGPEREVFKEFFRDLSGEARDHAATLGDKIVALGGVPTVEPGEIRQATELPDMLRQDLELERAAAARPLRRHDAARGGARPSERVEARPTDPLRRVWSYGSTSRGRQSKSCNEAQQPPRPHAARTRLRPYSRRARPRVHTPR